jgi:hypothetical protein
VDNFPKAKERPLGFGYLCRLCERVRSSEKNKKYPRTGRYKLMTAEQKAARRIVTLRYGKTSKGRAIFLVKALQKHDAKKGREFDLDQEFFLTKIMNKPCHYCGDTEDPIGADRIDNSIGHLKTNCLPACGTCNRARGDRLTVQEMQIVGKAIRLVKELRRKVAFYDAPHFQYNEGRSMAQLRDAYDKHGDALA